MTFGNGSRAAASVHRANMLIDRVVLDGVNAERYLSAEPFAADVVIV